MDYTSGGPVGGRPNHAKFSVPADMVALDKIQEPWNNQRHPTCDTRLSTFGGLPGATAKPTPARAIMLTPQTHRWNPRGGFGYAAWRADLTNRLSTNDLLDTSCNTDPPTLGAAEKTWADRYDPDVIFSLYKDACATYNKENTAVYTTS